MSPFRKHLARVLGSVVGLSLASCGPANERKLRKPMTNNLCVDGELSRINGLKPAIEPEYLALRGTCVPPYTFDEYQLSEEERKECTWILEETGTCIPANGCDETALPTADGWGSNFGWEHIWYVANGQSGFINNQEQAIEFLGVIDTPQEAALLVYLERGQGLYWIPCDGGDNYTEGSDGYLIYAESGSTCGENLMGHQLFVSREGTIEKRKTKIIERGQKGCVIGRLPEGLLPTPERESAGGRTIGQYFAEVSALEAASVAAFEQLTRELIHHRAPARLVKASQEAAHDEARHALLCGTLAEKFGAHRRVPVVETAAPRALKDIALDNAKEGLIRESFGALLAHHQAESAADANVAAVMSQIAEDETRHAEFSYELHEWLCARLRPSDLSDVEAHHRSSRTALSNICDHGLDEVTRDLLGLPDPATARRLYSELFSHV